MIGNNFTRLIVLAATLGALQFFAATARAATITVTNTNDSGAGSLRAAVTQANGTTADDTINFNLPAASCPSNVCTITLTSGELVISATSTAGALTVTNTNGTSANLVISGNNNSRIFYVNSGANFTINNVTMTRGNGVGTGSAFFGGAIYNNGGTLTVTNSTISGNDGSGNGGGGIVSIGGTATLTNSTFSGNLGRRGGAVFAGGTVTITNSTISGNSANGTEGGGIYFFFGDLTLTNSTVANNTASGIGGGIAAQNSPSINLLNTIVAGNTAPTGPDISGGINSNGYNFIGNDSGATITGTTTGNILNYPALLAPLGNYGGATQTQPLTANSRAVNAGTATGAPSSDQRGAARVGQADIGAFELNNSANGGAFRVVTNRGRQGNAFNYLLTANRGSFTYSVTAGSLPPGLSVSLNGTAYSITGTPTAAGTYNYTVTATDGTNSTATDYTTTILSPTAASVSLGGRVLVAGNRGLTNAVVYLTDQNGATVATRTTAFGYYRFDKVAAGQTVLVTVSSKRYNYAAQVVTVTTETGDLNFTPDN